MPREAEGSTLDQRVGWRGRVCRASHLAYATLADGTLAHVTRPSTKVQWFAPAFRAMLSRGNRIREKFTRRTADVSADIQTYTDVH